MSQRGVFAVDRGIWDDTDFANEPYSEREAFLWMLSEAAWRPTKVRVGANVIDLARGQLAFSTRFMATKWQWSEARVRRFLKRLFVAEIICTHADKKSTHVTILKYDRFQRVSMPDAEEATHQRRTSDAPATQQRRKEEYIEYREGMEDRKGRSSLRSDGARGAKSSRRQTIDPDWALGEAELVAAEKSGISRDRAAEIWPQFHDHHRNKGTLGLDWLAGWRTWCRNDVKFSGRDASRRQPAKREQTEADYWAAEALEAHTKITTGGSNGRDPFDADADPSRDRPGDTIDLAARRLDLRQAGADWRPVGQFRVVGGYRT